MPTEGEPKEMAAEPEKETPTEIMGAETLEDEETPVREKPEDTAATTSAATRGKKAENDSLPKPSDESRLMNEKLFGTEEEEESTDEEPLSRKIAQKLFRRQSATADAEMTEAFAHMEAVEPQEEESEQDIRELDIDEKPAASKVQVSENNSDDEDYAAEKEEEEEVSKAKGKRKATRESTPREDLRIGDQVREYLERSRLLELLASQGSINLRHTDSIYDTLQLTRYHKIDDACFFFTLDDRPFLRMAR
ncbi:hypothetical protein M569_01750 [Genlisea aurea]|uniref:Uncharacterized protein n=1 Tax=Genlisea aurea TaxID=192259 RepID=S8CZS9_9LAMI|nr:hypothetical protein M569_01750 [Genlisea aurea]